MRDDCGHGGHTQEADTDHLNERVRAHVSLHEAYGRGDSGVHGDAAAAGAATALLLNLIRVLQHVATSLEALLGDFAAFGPDQGE